MNDVRVPAGLDDEPRSVWSTRTNAILRKVNERVASSSDIADALALLLEEMSGLIGSHAATLYRYVPQERSLKLVCGVLDGQVGRNLSGHPHGSADCPAPVDLFPAWPDLIASGQAQFQVMSADSTPSPSYQWDVQHRHRSLLQTALIARGQPVGLMGLAFQAEVEVGESARDAFTALARQATLLLQLGQLAEAATNAELELERLVQARWRATEQLRERESSARLRAAAAELADRELQRRDRLVDAVAALSRELLQAADLADLLPRAFERIGRAAGLQCILLLEQEPSANQEAAHHVVGAWHAAGLLAHDAGGLGEISNCIASRVVPALRAGRAVWQWLDEPDPAMAACLLGLEVGSIAGVPLRVDGRYWGALAFGDSAPTRHWQSSEVDSLSTVADAIGKRVSRDRLELDRQTALLAERDRVARIREQELARASAALQNTIDEVARMGSLDNFIPRALRIAAEAFGVDSAGYFENVGEQIYLRFWLYDGRVYGPADLPGLSTGQYRLMADMARGFTVSKEHLGVDVVTRSRPSILHHSVMSVSPHLHDFALTMGWDWELNVPLVSGGRSEAAITWFRPEAIPFTETDFPLAEALAKQIALAMKVSRAASRDRELALVREQEQAVRRRALELRQANEALRRSTAQLVSSDNLPQFLDVVLLEAIKAAGAVSGAVFVHRAEMQALKALSMVVRGTAIDIARDLAGTPWRAPIPTAGNVPWLSLMRGQELVWVADYDNPHPDDWPQSLAWHHEHGHRFVVCISMKHGDEVIGFLGLCYDKSIDRPPASESLELCHVLAQQATLAVRLTDLSVDARRAAVLDERARLAREFHDSIAQNFIGIRMELQGSTSIDDDVAHKVMALASHGLDETRRAVRALGPSQLSGRQFEEALTSMARQTLAGSVKWTLNRSGEWAGLSTEVEGQLFRIIQEALNNVMRHAQASELRLELSASTHERSILISDNGKGLDGSLHAQEGGFGLFSMRQRAASIGAELLVVGEPGKGTQVFISLPCRGEAS